MSHRHVNRRSGGLRTSCWGLVLGVFFGEGLELCNGDNRRRSWWALSPCSRSSCLWSRVKQGSLGLLFPILKCLSPLSVGSECSLGEVTGIRLGRGVWDWSCASLARLIGTVYDRLRLRARALWCFLDRCSSVLLGHVCLWKVIRISQSSCICTLQCSESLLCHGSL